MNGRIKQLENEINQFQAEREKRQKTIAQAQQDLAQIYEAILTRQGGIVELKKLEDKK